MNYLIKINPRVMRDMRWHIATNEQRGVWIALFAYCTQAKNNGVIVGAENWTDHQWIRICSLSRDEIQDSPLVKLTADGLRLEMFSTTKERL